MELSAVRFQTFQIGTVPWGKSFWGATKPILPTPVAVRLLVFTASLVTWLLALSHQRDREKDRAIRKIKLPPVPLLSEGLSLFS